MGTNNIQGNSGIRPEYRPEFSRDRRAEGIRGGGQDRQLRAASGEISSQETRTLEITTDDGDTVSISIETSAQLEAEGFIAKGPNGRARGGSVSGEFSVSVNVEVTGELDADELKDIGNLLRTLASGGGNPAPKPIDPPPPPPPTVEGGPVTTTEPVTVATVEGENPPVDTLPADSNIPPIEEAPPIEDLPPVDDGTTLAGYTYTVESDVQGDFSRLQNPLTYG